MVDSKKFTMKITGRETTKDIDTYPVDKHFF